MATTQTGTSGTTDMRPQQGHVPDTTYDLISVMYHTLQGCQTYERYAQDAEHAGRQDIAQFFRDTGREFERCAERGRQLLAQCLQQGQTGQGTRPGQLNSQMGASGQQSQAGSGSRQQGPASGSRGQQGGVLESRGSSLGGGNTGSSRSGSGK